jgi:hypothetical protein
MDWQTELTVIDGTMYRGPVWLGRFSSHAAALEGLQLMRSGLRLTKCRALTEPDLDLLDCIDMDEA